MTLTFSSGMSLTDSSSTLTCSAIYGFSAASTMACAVQSSTVLKITNAFPDTDKYLLLNLNNVKLPVYVNTFTVTVATYSSSNVQIDSSSGSTFKFTTQAGVLSLALSALTSTTVGAFGNLQVTATVNDNVQTSGYMLMSFPKWNSGTQNTGLVTSMIQYASSDLQGSTGQYKIDCTSTAHPNLACLLTVVNPTSTSTIASTYDTLKIAGFSANITSSITFTLSNNRFRNPPSTKPITSITISSYNSAGFMIDQQKTPFSYAATTPLTLTSSQVSVQIAGSTGINQLSQYNIKIQTPLPMPIGTSMVITIPSQVKITSLTQTSQVVLNSAIGFSPLYSVIEVTITDQTNQVIELDNLVPFASNYVDVDSLAQITLVQLTNPPSTATSSTFQISVYDQQFIMMQSNSVTVQATGGVLSSVALIADNYRTRASAQYTFSFVIANALEIGSSVRIQMPSQFSIVSGSLAVTAISSLSTSSTVTYDSTNRYIIVQNGVTSKLPIGSLVKFTITAGIINPINTKTTDAFVISTLDSTGNVVDQDSSLTITPTANEIPQVAVTACSDKPSQSYTSQTCTYQMRIYPTQNFPILANSYLLIQLPSELTFTSTTAAVQNSYSEGVEDSKLTVSLNSSQVLKFQNLFSPSDSTQTTYTLDSFAIYIANITTPRSTQPTGSFKVYIYDSSDNIEYQKTSLILSQVAQASPFTNVLVKRSSEVNGAQNVAYNFTFINSLPISKNEFIKVTPPSAITIVSTPGQCVGITSLQSSLSCAMQNSSLIINIQPSSDVKVDSVTSMIAAGTVFTFSVNNMTNPLSSQPADSFQVYLSTSRIYNYYVNQGTQGLSFINAQTGTLTNVEILPDSIQLSATTNYAFYFTTANIMPDSSIIEVQFPSSLYSAFTTTTQTCQVIKNLPNVRTTNGLQCKVKSSNKQVIQIVNGFNNTQLSSGQVIGFSIFNIKNPATSVAQNSQVNQIVITTKTSTGFTIDQSSNIDFSIGCTSPCQKCKTDATTCTSCVQSDASNPFYLFQSTCGKTCPSGYYDDSLYTCQKCTYPCSNCMLNSTFCTSCQQSSSLPYIDDAQGKCYQSCPTGTYVEEQTNSCANCVSPCNECSSPNKCLSCVNNYFIFNSQCFANCPNTSVPLISSSSSILECEECKSPCYTCSGARDNCTSCQLTPTTYYLYQSQCLETCPAPYLPNDQNVCQKMDQPTYPFLTFILTGSIILVIIISNRVYPRTKFFTSILALQSVAMVPIWIYLIIFLMRDNHLSSSGLVFIGLIMNFILNFFWYLYYRKKILKLDQNYQLYKKYYPKSSGAIVLFSFVLTFQLFRLIYSRLFDIKSLSCELQLKQKYYQKLNRYSLFQITFVYMPIIAANIYNLFWTWYGRQVFWIDIECIITSVIMLISHTIIIYRTEHLYTIAKYDPQNTTTNITKTYVNNSTSLLDTTPRGLENTLITYGEGGPTDNGERAAENNNNNEDEEIIYKANQNKKDAFDSDYQKQQRQEALNRIIRKVKGDKDASDILGVTMEDNQIDQSADLQKEEGDGDTSVGLDQLILGNSRAQSKQNQKRKMVDDKQYLSVGLTPQTADKTIRKTQNGKGKSKLGFTNQRIEGNQINDRDEGVSSSISQYATDQKYRKLQQDSYRDDHSQQNVVNKLNFTSAPIDADEILQKDQDAQFKLEQFQREAEILNKMQDKSWRKSSLKVQRKADHKDKYLNSGQYYHTLGMQETDRGDGAKDANTSNTRNQASNKPPLTDNISDMPSVSGFHLANNIMRNVVDNQTSHLDDQSHSNFQSYPLQQNQLGSHNQSRNLPLNQQTPIQTIQTLDQKNNNQKQDFDSLYQEIGGAKIKLKQGADIGNEEDEDDKIKEEMEFSILKKKLDHKAIANLRRDVDMQGEVKGRKLQQLNELRSETEDMDAMLLLEQSRKDELNVIVYDLQQQIAFLLLQLEEEKLKRDRELEMIEEANYTSDEEEMGVTPSSYNVLNQRFSDGEDVKIYLNMIGQGHRQMTAAELQKKQRRMEQDEEYENDLEQQEEDMLEMEPSAAASKSRRQSTAGNQANRKKSRRSRANGNGALESQKGSQGSKASINARRMSGKIVPFDQEDQENSNSQTSLNDEDDLAAGDSISMTKDDFLRMLEQETKDAIAKMRELKSKEDQEFAKYAESFLKQLTSPQDDINGKPRSSTQLQKQIQTAGGESKSLLEYIRELDKRERKQIEEKYRRLFGETKELKKKLKNKKRKKKAVPQDDSNKYDPYFRYLPFEKAVIESNGRTPYDNKQVEMLVKQKSSTSNVTVTAPMTKRAQTTTSRSNAKNNAINQLNSAYGVNENSRRESQLDFGKQVLNVQETPPYPKMPDISDYQINEESQDLYDGLPSENDNDDNNDKQNKNINLLQNMLI